MRNQKTICTLDVSIQKFYKGKKGIEMEEKLFANILFILRKNILDDKSIVSADTSVVENVRQQCPTSKFFPRHDYAPTHADRQTIEYE